ncbi:short-chain dehydrogenase [Thiohalobacter sp. COW1]|uniref:NAD-dependent epimerase/dehydratase family protein n=1 Tax=Thiohalobacter sp. COW1 TaxID=2795687 RepID=UPI0019163AA1|nr:NAD-dependent epimerase/dehydratase family protein [Thiohalobacter sp. COW1]BCO31249.1 short-chain dehydrogenase [Thiohalobacter sp. COW1]
MTGTVAVTGATGFVGQAIVETLLRSGWRVRALVHRRGLDDTLTGALETVSGGLGDEAALARLLEDVDAVVHVAGKVRGRGPRDFRPVNADGVERLARLALARPEPPRFILISSLAAREPGLSHYAASKREGESRLAGLAAGTAMHCAVLRPPAVYGPGDRELLPLFQTMARGLAPVLGRAGARASLLHVNDLAAAVAKLLASDAAGTYELHDGTPGGYSWEDIAAIVAAVAGRRPGRRLMVPGMLLRGLAGLNLAAATLLRYQPMLTPGKVRELRHPDWVCDNTALTRDTGWRPAIRLRDGLQPLLGSSGPRTNEGISNVH